MTFAPVRLSLIALAIATLSTMLVPGAGAATSLAANAAENAAAPAEEDTYDLRAHYTKYEFRIPMRDGVRLFTVVYVPRTAARPIRS